MIYNFFFFKQKTAYEVRISDWSSDVCSSDLQISATVAAGIRSLLLEFLPADQPRQQAVIGQIERIELIETLERVEVSAAALDQIEHRFIEYRDRELDRLAAGVARRGGKLDQIGRAHV